jgi:hypothetical protein
MVIRTNLTNVSNYGVLVVISFREHIHSLIETGLKNNRFGN